jgi:nucleotide-binding universal stress UspA family protein
MRLLLAIDDSNFSEAAVQAVIAHREPKGTEIQVLNVVDLDIPIPTSYAANFRQESLKRGQELVHRAEEVLSKAGFKVQAAVEEGDPKSKILDHAARWKADLIVMGSHGRKGSERFLMGSVSDGVARHAPCSVEIVRLPITSR